MTNADRLAALPPAVLAVAQRGLAAVSWQIRSLEVDTETGAVSLYLHRADGRWLHLHRDHIGRVVLERWHRRQVVTKYRPGRNPTSNGFVDEFLGRQNAEGLRMGLRLAALYISDNGSKALGREALRPVFALLPANI